MLRTPLYIVFIVIHAIFLNASEHTYDEVVFNKKRLEILFSSLYAFYSFKLLLCHQEEVHDACPRFKSGYSKVSE
jgi:hypothetical protein